MNTGLRSAGGAPYVISLCRRGFVSESVYKLFSWGTFLPKIIFKVSADHVCCCRFAQGLRAQALTQSLLLKFESKYLLAFCLPLMRVQRSYVRRFHILSSHQMTFNFFQRLFLTHKIFLPINT